MKAIAPLVLSGLLLLSLAAAASGSGLLNRQDLVSITIVTPAYNFGETEYHEYLAADPRLVSNTVGSQEDFHPGWEIWSDTVWYDVYVSDSSGNLDSGGDYFTVACITGYEELGGQLDALFLRLDGDVLIYANKVVSFIKGTAAPGGLAFCLGPEDATTPYLGFGYSRLTVRFPSRPTCCIGQTGDVNSNYYDPYKELFRVDLADLSALVYMLTGGSYVPACMDEANVDWAGIVDLTDLSLLVSYLTGGGVTLPECY